MSGNDASQSTFEHAMKPLSDFIDDEPSEEELLELAFKNAERKQSAVKDEFRGNTLSAFSAWHRRLGPSYAVTDADWVYYRPRQDEIYLIVENKCVPDGPFNANTVVNVQPSDYQRGALKRLGENSGCPVYVRWWTKKDNADEIAEKAERTYETCYVRELGSNSTPRELNGVAEHEAWIDEFRPSVSAGGDTDE